MATHPLVSAGVYSTQVGGAAPENLAEIEADYATWVPGMPIIVTHFGFVVTTAIAGDSVAPVVSLDDRPTAGSDTSRAEIDTITVTDGLAAGETLVATPAPYVVGLGHELVFEHKTTAEDAGTAAGQGYYFVGYETCPQIDTADTNYNAA